MISKKIILVGLPCSGKTYFSKYYSDYFNCNYVDTDEKFEEEYNIDPIKFINMYGFDKFREKIQRIQHYF